MARSPGRWEAGWDKHASREEAKPTELPERPALQDLWRALWILADIPSPKVSQTQETLGSTYLLTPQGWSRNNELCVNQVEEPWRWRRGNCARQEVHPTLSPSLWRPSCCTPQLAGPTFLNRLCLSGAGHRRGPHESTGCLGKMWWKVGLQPWAVKPRLNWPDVLNEGQLWRV